MDRNFLPISRRSVLKVLGASSLVPGIGWAAPPSRSIAFSVAQVSLDAGPFLHSQRVNREYLLAHDVDRFLAAFRREAGLPARAEQYPNWESTGLDGHCAGHYLTALAQAAATGDAELRGRLDAMLADLAACQRANGDGYVGAIPGGKAMSAEIKAGQIESTGFALNGKWVPFYNLHKLFAGLRDAWWIAGQSQARDILVGLSDWCSALVSGLSDAQLQEILRTEHGGMNEVLADVYAITGDRRYLSLAKRFSHRAILDPLLRQQDALDGLHANTQIPKVIGFARIGELSGDEEWTSAVRYFWQTVTARRSVAIGGHGMREHFNPANDFSGVMETPVGPETCNSYNMLRLTEILYRNEPLATYADYSERTLFNHILSSQHPQHGGLVYYTPMRPRHYRVYSRAGHSFWCCVGTGMENHGKHAGFIYSHTDDALTVNQFIASQLEWEDRGLRLVQQTRFPDEGRTQLTFTLKRPLNLSLRIRHPAWVAAGGLVVQVNGQPWRTASAPSSYAEITREWRSGDCVTVELPMRTTVERPPDGSDYVAVLHGPIVLAARTGTDDLDGLVAGEGRYDQEAPGPLLPMDTAPMLVGDAAAFAASVRPVEGRSLTFRAETLIRPQASVTLELMPFFRLHDARYLLYWQTATADAYPAVVAAAHAREAAELALAARTLDRVLPGEQQPEVDHQLASAESDSGQYLGRHWRDAGKWFSYTLQVPPGRRPSELLLVYYGGQSGRSFDIRLNGQVIASVTLQGGRDDIFIEKTYPIPATAEPDKKGHYVLEFLARNGQRTGSIYDLRLLAADPAAAANV